MRTYSRTSALMMFAVAISLMGTTACSHRQITRDNDLPSKLMDEKVELNAELIGQPYNPASKVTFWVTTANTDMGGMVGAGRGMIFRKAFDKDSLRVVTDGTPHTIKSKQGGVNEAECPDVSKDVVKAIAHAKDVKVYLTANGGSVRFESEFSKKNFVKFQEFVQQYVDPNQEVERSFFLLRWFGLAEY